MSLRLYSIRELLDAAKAVIRAGISGVGTEDFTDHDLIANSAVRLLHGAQVAGKYIFDQLSPGTADAQNRDRMIDFHGLTFAKSATKARGMIAVESETLAGTELTFSGTCFHDGLERTFVTLEDSINVAGASVDYPVGLGSTIHKFRTTHADGVVGIDARSIALVSTDEGNSSWINGVRRVNVDDQSVDFYSPVKGTPVFGSAGDGMRVLYTGCVVSAECTVAGEVGNCHRASISNRTVLEMAGGCDEVGEIDGDEARVQRLIEDTLACPPSFGNAQHWREIALACPDVDLDDAVVYRHVRGPGTVDIVCIGRSGGMRSTAFPDAHIEFTFFGNNTRRIGDTQADRVESWCRAQASYFDDLKVRSVEWDWCGESSDVYFAERVFSSFTVVEATVDAYSGYGPDSGVAIAVFPHTRHATRLYAATNGTRIDSAILPGHRVWATVSHSTSDGRNAFATIVTEVIAVDPSGLFATIADVKQLAPPNVAAASQLAILRWGTAGPVTQDVIDAVYAYFDSLGPGSFLIAPKDPGYVRNFWPTSIANPEPGIGVDRWPPEGRRWNAGLRASELQAAILAVEGVRSVDLGSLIDFDPQPMMTLALTGVVARY